MEEINLRELFYIFKKRIFLTIGLTLLALISSATINFFVLTPRYETFTTLMVGKPRDFRVSNTSTDVNDMLLNQELVHTYGELVKSRLVADKVIKNLELKTSYEEFQEKIGVSLVNNTGIIKIQVRDKDKELSAQIANEVAEQFIKVVKLKMKVENVQIIDQALVPERPSSPRKALNTALGTAIGFALGVLLSFLLEYLDNTFKSSDDVEKELDLPVLGAIPFISEKEREIIVKSNPKSPVSEAFRTLRTNIQFTNIDKNMKILAVTSSIPEEGKSTVASNLAISLAQEGKEVLLVDCDLRKPKIYKIFEILSTFGLTNILMGINNISEVVFRPINIKGFSIVSSGPIPPNPSELLSSESMKRFLDRARDEYDIVILDTPPIAPVTDAAVLSTLIDGILLVIKASDTEIAMTKHAKELLDKVNANIIGTVLNNIPIKNGKYVGYGYMEYYSYYGEDA